MRGGGARLLALVMLAAAPAASAAQEERFEARLSVMPLTVAMQATIAGEGAARATLSGRRLEVTGAYHGLKSAAAGADIRQARPGLRGPAILPLTLIPDGGGASGRLSGATELTDAQIAALKAGDLYIQLSSQGAPDGNLRGWLAQTGR